MLSTRNVIATDPPRTVGVRMVRCTTFKGRRSHDQRWVSFGVGNVNESNFYSTSAVSVKVTAALLPIYAILPRNVSRPLTAGKRNMAGSNAFVGTNVKPSFFERFHVNLHEFVNYGRNPISRYRATNRSRFALVT